MIDVGGIVGMLFTLTSVMAVLVFSTGRLQKALDQLVRDVEDLKIRTSIIEEILKKEEK